MSTAQVIKVQVVCDRHGRDVVPVQTFTGPGRFWMESYTGWAPVEPRLSAHMLTAEGEPWTPEGGPHGSEVLKGLRTRYELKCRKCTERGRRSKPGVDRALKVDEAKLFAALTAAASAGFDRISLRGLAAILERLANLAGPKPGRVKP